jgi:hypothetical protein
MKAFASISASSATRKRRRHAYPRLATRSGKILADRTLSALSAFISIEGRPLSCQSMRQLSSLLLVLASITACASGPQTRRLGEYTVSQPLFTAASTPKTPRQITVNLKSPEYVSVLYVVPGRGAVIVYPTDSATDTHVDAGQHTVPVYFSERPYNRDSAYAAARREAMGGGTRMPRVRRDTVATDSVRMRGDTTRYGFGGLREPGPGASPVGYLLLVASPMRIPYASLARHVDGITIPIDDDEALSTVMKLVKAALPDGAPLAGYAQELERT